MHAFVINFFTSLCKVCLKFHISLQILEIASNNIHQDYPGLNILVSITCYTVISTIQTEGSIQISISHKVDTIYSKTKPNASLDLLETVVEIQCKSLYVLVKFSKYKFDFVYNVHFALLVSCTCTEYSLEHNILNIHVREN